MFKRILVPLDGSALAEAALPAAVTLAEQFNSELILFRVVTPQHFITHIDGSVYAELLVELRQQNSDAAYQYLMGVKETLADKDIAVRTVLLEDEQVAEAILENAAKMDVDTIVMSTHGRGGISRWVYGSVADKVLRQADMPVLLIRASEEKEAEED
ncbi:MAG TPA: universal stress protein [Anaerolineae bacterium]|nr:universal stress protein [Anaerolineae bacterium]HIP73875.1 universal stress protein [Anaerolineae bacterium]